VPPLTSTLLGSVEKSRSGISAGVLLVAGAAIWFGERTATGRKLSRPAQRKVRAAERHHRAEA